MSFPKFPDVIQDRAVKSTGFFFFFFSVGLLEVLGKHHISMENSMEIPTDFLEKHP